MIPQILASLGNDFKVGCPEDKLVEVVKTDKNGRNRTTKEPVLLEGIAQKMRIVAVRYRQERTAQDYSHDDGVLYTGSDLKIHEGKLVRVGENKKTKLPYLTIVDSTRLKVTETDEKGFVKLTPQYRSVKQSTLSFLEINGVKIIEDGKLIENPKPNLSFVMQLAWEIRREYGLQMGNALQLAWRKVRA